MSTMTDQTKEPYRIAVRFGDAILQAGHTAVPNLALNHYASLGVTHAEMMFAIHIWQYWWTEQDPYPALGTIAEKMGVSRRQARNYAQGLKRKGYLEVQERHLPGLGQITSEYNFAPFIEAIVRIAGQLPEGPRNDRSGGGWKDPSAAPRKPPSAKEDPEQADSLSNASSAFSGEGQRARSGQAARHAKQGTDQPGFSSTRQILERQRPATPSKQPQSPSDTTTIASYISDLRLEFNDQAAARTTTTRALNLYRRAGSDLASFIGALYQARALTRERLSAPPNGPTPAQSLAPPKRPLAYFFAVLEQTLGLRQRPDPGGGE